MAKMFTFAVLKNTNSSSTSLPLLLQILNDKYYRANKNELFHDSLTAEMLWYKESSPNS